MPQMISRNTVLLQGAGRTNIEYSAGPNINITNDVISGKDWSNEIAEAAGSSVSSHLSGGDHISIETNDGISTISVTGDLYSAGDNINITNNVISGKDWTNDIDEHINSAISSKADASAIPEIVDYSAGANIDITDHVISGKDWSYEIGQKADRSEVIERISAASESIVNNLTETISSTSSELYDIISATSGQGGGSCPWISGGKDYGSATVQLNFGDTIPVFSSWGLSADHNHYIWMKGAYIRLPDGSEFLPNSAFSSYTASMASNMENNWNYTNSAYSMSLTNHYDKLENSAFSAYTAAHSADDVIPYSGANGIDVTDHVISFTGEAGSNYSAGANIDITDNVISGKDWTSEISAASSILNQMIASGDNVAYSAGNNINITDHVVSGKDWLNEIASSTSGKLDSSWTAGKDVTPYSAGSNINVTNHVISGKDWTQTIDEHIASAISSVDIPSAKPVSGTSGIKIEETENSVIFSISGDVGKTYSAGDNIYISNQNVISGRNWTSNINAATSGKLDSTWTAGKDVTPYSAGDNINVTNHVISGKNWSNDINAATSGKLDKSWSAGKDVTPYSAGSNINITNHVVSGKDWTDTILSAVSSHSGATYTSPSATILVDNDNSRLEASTSGILEHVTPASLGLVTTAYTTPATTLSGVAIAGVAGGAQVSVVGVAPQMATWYWGNQSGTWGMTPGSYAPSTAILTGNSGTTHDLIISGINNNQSISASAYKVVPASTSYEKVDLWNNYSAGNGVSIENHVINASGKVYTSPSGTIRVDNTNNRLEASTSGIAEIVTPAGVNQVNGTFTPSDYSHMSGTAITDVVGGTSLTIKLTDWNSACWFWGTQSGVYQGQGSSPQAISSYPLTGTSGEVHNLILSGMTYNTIYATAYKSTPSTTSYKKVDLWDNYSAGEGITINNHIISAAGKQYTGVAPVYVNNETNMIGVSAAWKLSAGDGVSFTVDEPNSTLTVNAEGGGDRNYYAYSTPATSYTAEGDLTFRYNASQSTPSRIYASIGSADVGLLAPTDAFGLAMLVTNWQGGVYWTAQSAVIPKAYTGTYYKCRVCTAADSDEALDNMPSTAEDFVYTIINGNSSSYIYYSADEIGTATLNPGQSVTMFWNKNDERLWCTPTDEAYGQDEYAYRYLDLDGLQLRQVATSAQATANNVLYIITGGN